MISIPIISVLLTCHNRKDKTVQCLTNLFVQQDLNIDFKLEVFLVDDGCTDGTAEAIKNQFPKVTIVKGDGTLFWSRGMHTAWIAAAKHKDYDAYLWINDDTFLFKNALQTMLKAAEETNFHSIVCGNTCSEKNGSNTYGGFRTKEEGLLVPNGQLQECRIINGNFVLVPRKIYSTIGNIDWTFRHAIGDFDYGLRAIKAGFKNYVTHAYIGTCELNPSLPKWCLKETPIKKRFDLLYSPLGSSEPIPFFIYEKRHFGLLRATKHFITINIRALIPQLWK
jgi:GT2 family glycosyltransferase